MKSSTTKWIAIATAASIMGFMATGNAWATEQHPDRNITFAAQYAQNTKTEATLLQKVQTGSTENSSIASITATVETINAQVSALYTVEQNLIQAKPTIPTSNNIAQKLTGIIKTHAHLESEIRDGQHTLKQQGRKDRKDRGAMMGEKLKVQIWQDQLRELNQHLIQPQRLLNGWSQHPFNNGLTQLDTTILSLQKAGIHYTQEWLALENASSIPVPTTALPTSISSIAYDTTTITRPTTSTIFTTDAIAQAPIVKDQNGNTLADTGNYILNSPTGATGVTINAATGLLTVSAGATVGTYTVTYTQGTLSIEIAIAVIQ